MSCDVSFMNNTMGIPYHIEHTYALFLNHIFHIMISYGPTDMHHVNCCVVQVYKHLSGTLLHYALEGEVTGVGSGCRREQVANS